MFLAIAALRRGGLAQEPCLCLRQHAFEGHGRKVMALINDHVSVLPNQLVNCVLRWRPSLANEYRRSNKSVSDQVSFEPVPASANKGSLAARRPG